MSVLRRRAAGQSEKRGATVVGRVWAEPVVASSEGVVVNHAFFEPRLRTTWHEHEGAQLLNITFGRDSSETTGSNGAELRPSGPVTIRSGEVDWHGAQADGVCHTSQWRLARPDGTSA
jgi:quercetin dioxygenase-like cupin family protein